MWPIYSSVHETAPPFKLLERAHSPRLDKRGITNIQEKGRKVQPERQWVVAATIKHSTKERAAEEEEMGVGKYI